MKKLTIFLVLILSLVISYFTATAVNLYNVSRLSKVSNDNVLTRNLIIMDYDSVDRSQLIEHIMEVASQNNIFVSTGWFSDNSNSRYYFGPQEYINYLIINQVPRTKNNSINLSDKNFTLNSFSDGEYGKIVSVGGFPSSMLDLEFYSFKKVEETNISIDSRVEIMSLYGIEAIENAIEDLSNIYPELNIFYEAREGSYGESNFTWNESITNYVLLSLIFVILLIMLSIIVVVKKQERLIAISRLYGHSALQISTRLFAKFILILILVFILGAIIFDYFIIKDIAFYNLLYYQVQMVIIVCFILVVLFMFVLSTFVIKLIKVAGAIKTKSLDQELLYYGLILKFILVVVLLSSYIDIYHEFIKSTQSFFFYQTNKDELSRISYISGSMEEMRISEWKQINIEINEKLIEEDIDLYCINYPESYVNNKRNEVNIVNVNTSYVKKYLPSISDQINDMDLTNKGILFIPDSEKIKLKELEKFLPFSYLSGEIITIEEIPKLYFYYTVPDNINNLILYVSDAPNEYTGPKVSFPCYIFEENTGSTSNIDSVVESISTSNTIITKSNEANVLRNISYNTSVLLENSVQAILSFSIVISFFLMMLIIYLYTNLKLIVIKKNLGYSDWQTFSYFLGLNAIIYGSSFIYLLFKGNLDWTSFALLLLLMTLEIASIKIYLLINKKRFKKWLS